MTRIKICGLSRPEDIDAVNAANPDFAGFIIDVPKSHRSVTPDQVRKLAPRLNPNIIPVGVFVDAPIQKILTLVAEGTLGAIQLHGHETAATIRALKEATDTPIFQAFKIQTAADVRKALRSPADHLLLDGGAGDGRPFNWHLVENLPRPFMLAGGLTPENIPTACKLLSPWAMDLSSGVERSHLKDPALILQAVAQVRKTNNE